MALVVSGALATACVEAAAPVPPAAGADILLARDSEVFEGRVPRNATLDGLLRDHGLSADLSAAVVDSLRGVFNPRSLRANRPYRVVSSLDGLLRRFEYEIDAERFLRIVSRDGGAAPAFEAEVVRYEMETALVSLRAVIDADHPSLVAAIAEAEENVQLAITLAEVLSGEVDFNSDLREGDVLDLLFEKRLREGEPAGYGAIVAAALENDGRLVQAFRFTGPDGEPGYYDRHGRSLRRMFLKSPLPFEPRITSRFSRRRFHPIYRTYRPHLGVDYGAPTGTPVVAVASGVVVSAAPDGESGRMVRLRHSGGYHSYYLHLSSFARGIRRGVRVNQGQMIGRVGMTGTATAPHLDFRLRKDGVFINPLTAHRNMPPGQPIAKALLPAFQVARDRAADRLVSTGWLAAAPQAITDAAGTVSAYE